MSEDMRCEDDPDDVLDPNGPPQPRRADLPQLPGSGPPGEARWGGLPIAACVIAAGGVVLGLLESTSRPCMGATRSARLKWQARLAQVEQALRDEEGATGNDNQLDGTSSLADNTAADITTPFDSAAD